MGWNIFSLHDFFFCPSHVQNFFFFFFFGGGGELAYRLHDFFSSRDWKSKHF